MNKYQFSTFIPHLHNELRIYNLKIIKGYSLNINR